MPTPGREALGVGRRQAIQHDEPRPDQAMALGMHRPQRFLLVF